MALNPNANYFLLFDPQEWGVQHFRDWANPPPGIEDRNSWANGFFGQKLRDIIAKKFPFRNAKKSMVARAQILSGELRENRSKRKQIRRAIHDNPPPPPYPEFHPSGLTPNDEQTKAAVHSLPQSHPSSPIPNDQQTKAESHSLNSNDEEKKVEAHSQYPDNGETEARAHSPNLNDGGAKTTETGRSPNDEESITPTNILSPTPLPHLETVNYHNRFRFFQDFFYFPDGSTLEEFILHCPLLSINQVVSRGLIDLSNENIRALLKPYYKDLQHHATQVPKSNPTVTVNVTSYPNEAHLYMDIYRHARFFGFIEDIFQSLEVTTRRVDFPGCHDCHDVLTYEVIEIYFRRTVLLIEHQLRKDPNPQHIFYLASSRPLINKSPLFAIITSFSSITFYSFTYASEQFRLVASVWFPVNQETIRTILEHLQGVKESLEITVQKLKSKRPSCPAIISENQSCRHFQSVD